MQLVPDGFNQYQAASCPECGAHPWRNCTDMEWFDVHESRAAMSESIIARW